MNGRSRDLMIDSAGRVYVVEEQLDPDKAPAPVRAALEAKGHDCGAGIRPRERQNHVEGQVKTKAGKKVSMELDADGKPTKK